MRFSRGLWDFQRVLFTGILVLLTTCGDERAPKTHSQVEFRTKEAVEVSQVIEDLRAAKPKGNIRSEAFERIKGELMRRLEERKTSKIALAPPRSEASRVKDLTARLSGTTVTLSWSYVNLGDYAQDGTVGIEDITPLAEHLFHSGEDALDEVIDGSGNGAVGIEDVTPIAENLFTDCAGYKVESARPDGSFLQVGEVRISEMTGAGLHRGTFEFSLELGDFRRFRVVPYDKFGEAGISSNEVSISPAPPKVNGVSPLSGTSGEIVTFSATVSGTPPFSFAWNFGGGAIPNNPIAQFPTVTLGNPGTYDCSLDVQNAYGNCSYNFQLSVEETPQPSGHELWLLVQKNLLVDANTDASIALAQRAKDAGYTTIVHADYKFGIIDILGDNYDHYVQNLQRYVNAVKQAGLNFIPALVPIGYSDAFLQHNPNLIEGQPVVDALFEVRDGVADVVQDPATLIANGDFESRLGDAFADWIQMDGAGVSTFADTAVFHSGSTSIRFEDFTAGNPTGNDRIRQRIAVKPWHCYAISIWLKTENVSPVGSLSFRVFADDPSFEQLTFLTYDIAPTQDWTRYYLIFNSQDYNSVWLYIGIWGGQSGRFWVDDVSIENAGLINLIRREGAPLVIKSEDGSTVYVEGTDYEYVEDPKMGHAGGWPGTYDLYHERPVIRLTPGSRIPDGTRLLVSYYHAVFVYDMQAAVCLSEPETYDIIRSTLTEINSLIHPSAVFISVDELRTVNWCQACQSRGMTPGELLADATQQIEQIAREINPNWKLITWSDMYDPYHNAHDNYYLANGTLEGSWEGLPASWDIANWRHFGNRAETIEFFANRGHRQILTGFYDEDPANFTIDEWLTDAKPYPGVYAVMYATWRDDFSQLEAWAQAVRNWESANP